MDKLFSARPIASLIFALVLLWPLTGHSQKAPQLPAQIVMGGPISLSGAYAKEGSQGLWGFQLAEKWINDVYGGVRLEGKKIPVKYINYDDESKKESVTSLLEKDLVRIDHFRGFEAYWEIPAAKPTAKIGKWVPGPGAAFFKAIKAALGDLPIIAEDLGVITPDVVELRDSFHLPGMKILQFGFSGADNPFLPHNYPKNCVAYTGTHDNDTTLGWFKTAPAAEREFGLKYFGRDGQDIVWDMIRAVWSSVAVFALAPMQDILTLDTQGRMNFPGKPSGNWTWRMPPWATEVALKSRLKTFNFLFGRSPEAHKIQQILKVLY